MLVSVIINVHNGEKYLSEAIKSALSQTYQEYEIIIWDNNSTDGTKKVVDSFTNKKIKYFRSKRFNSLGIARNKAILESKGDLIAFLDSDDLWMPDKLDLQVPIFNNPKIGIVISDSVFFKKDKDLRQLFKTYKPPTGKVFSELISNYFISLETAVIRKQALNSLDYWFDDRFNVIEEYDLFIRLCYLWELGYVDKVLGKWRVHNESWTWKKSDSFLIERKQFFKKLKEEIPNFTKIKYPKEYHVLQRSIDWDQARVLWSKGDKSSARNLLKNYLHDGIKWKIVYWLSWLPYSLFKKLAIQLGRIVP